MRSSFVKVIRWVRPFVLLFVLMPLASGQSSCIWKLWSEEEPLEERTFDIYGTVKTITAETLVITSDKGEMEFAMVESSIKGSDFGSGAYVHVYYKILDDTQEVTMVVEKVD